MVCLSDNVLVHAATQLAAMAGQQGRLGREGRAIRKAWLAAKERAERYAPPLPK